MAKIRQFYGGAGVPLHIEADVTEPAAAWRSQRARVRAWLDDLPDAEWKAPTRCDVWDITGLVRHMISASQFLGYTLHEAAGGTATTLLRDFDTRATVEAAAAGLGDLTPSDAQRELAAVDASVDREVDRMREAGWSVLAEAPPGQIAAHLSLSHFLFDSWVHEYDLMLPRGEQPRLDPLEAEVTARYLMGLAVLGTDARVPVDVRLIDIDRRIGIEVNGDAITVTVGAAPPGAAVIEGAVADVVDRTTGRVSGPVAGDDRALAVIDAFATFLST